MSKKLNQHLNDNNLQEIMQSAYKSHHSTETALLRVSNDILKAADNKQVTILVLLDLSAAFDTILRLNITGNALDWFRSYLQLRSQKIKVGSEVSDQYPLQYGVPQGSVLGPLLFGIYVLPLGDLLRHFGMSFHQYADDTQLYISMRPVENEVQQSVSSITNCISQVKIWMTQNMLKLNSDKTEFLILGSQYCLSKASVPSLLIEDSEVQPCDTIRNLGVIFNSTMSLVNHVSSICKSVNFHLRNIGMIRKYLTPDAAQRAVHAVITS